MLEVRYVCANCDYESTSRRNVERHLTNKIPCGPKVEIRKICLYRCETCGKQFQHQSSKCRHVKKCTASEKQDIIKELAEIKDTLKKQDRIAAPIHVSIGTMHNTIHAYGTDMPRVTYEKLKRLLTRGVRETIIRLVDENHFNIDRPESMNFYISNYKDNIGRFFDGEDWGMKNAEMLVDEVFDKYRNIIDDMLDDLMTDSEDDESVAEMKSKIFEKLGKLIDKWYMRTGKTDFEEGVKHELKDFIYGKKSLVKKVHRIK